MHQEPNKSTFKLWMEHIHLITSFIKDLVLKQIIIVFVVKVKQLNSYSFITCMLKHYGLVFLTDFGYFTQQKYVIIEQNGLISNSSSMSITSVSYFQTLWLFMLLVTSFSLKPFKRKPINQRKLCWFWVCFTNKFWSSNGGFINKKLYCIKFDLRNELT